MKRADGAVAAAWHDEMRLSRLARAERDSDVEWRHLERAHILSQPWPLPHVRTHAAMLGYAIRARDGGL
jgi:hypothetical protein